MEVIDNFLSDVEFAALKSSITDRNFPWFYQDKIVSDQNAVFEDGEDANMFNFQFYHMFYHDLSPRSSFYNDLAPVLSRIAPKALVKVKANLTMSAHKRIYTGYHIDFDNTPKNFKTAILYLNSNDGYTQFKTGEKIESVENRFVVFDTNKEHTGVSSTDTKGRYLLNFNYYDE